MDTRLVPFTSHHGTRYDEETRERARELWFFLYGRNAEAGAKALEKECPGLEGRTVRRWAADGEWATWGEAAIGELAPGLAEAVVIDLVAGGPESVAYLRAAVRGEQKAEAARVYRHLKETRKDESEADERALAEEALAGLGG